MFVGEVGFDIAFLDELAFCPTELLIRDELSGAAMGPANGLEPFLP